MTLLWIAPLLAGPLEEEVELVRAGAWEASLEGTDYAPSPYASPQELPKTLEIETHYQGFNDYYYYALVDGKIWYKPRFKRPAGEPEIATDLPWKLLGHNDGLPYRLEDPDEDTTWADGERSGWVVDRVFEDSDDWQAAMDPSLWDAAGMGEPELDPDFPTAERIIAITADADEIAVLTDERRMFYRRKFANIFVPDEWMFGWGQAKDLPVYFPVHLTDNLGWSLGRITAAGVGYKEGPDDRIFEWGPAAVSMETMVWLSKDGKTIYYLDSGTPPEIVHFVEPPLRGRWSGVSINAAASTIMLLDRFGAVQTKIADFDLLGSTPTHPYCYFEECDDEPFYKAGDIRSGMADIRLPSEGWMVHEPVVDPADWSEDTWISDRITILQTGKGNAERELRIVGEKEGVRGYYYKKLSEDSWSFRAAPEGDKGFDEAEPLTLIDLARYAGPRDLAALHADEPLVDSQLVGRVDLGGLVFGLHVQDFNPEASPWQVTLTHGDIRLPMELHVVQAWNPYMPPHPDDIHIVTYEGTLAYDQAELMRALGGLYDDHGKALTTLVRLAKNNKFALVVNTTEDGIWFRTKYEDRTGPIEGIAARPELAVNTNDMEAWRRLVWVELGDHMGWRDAIDDLSVLAPPETCEPGHLRWAAEVIALEEDIEADLDGLKSVWKEARGFARFTFATSGFFYATGIKAVDAALDHRRANRSDDVRPNELRFNVIVGVSERIPYLARNIATLHKARYALALGEEDGVREDLDALVAQAWAIGDRCED